ncbi:putative pectin lyase a precursor [Penicillium digitatum]|uniref:Putative pectin lyase a n=1 Tax=Penicillium digitatum TaxID=36651 RepID=A0A7T7BJ32_PENDI|nr:putative pectin lyase a precursor [Penicillium digitatum]
MNSNENYAVFRECLSNAIVARSEEKPKPTRRKPKGKRTERKDFIASETFATFPILLQTLSYAAIQHDPTLSTLYIPPDTDTPLPRATLETLFSPIPVSVTDSLLVYGIIPDTVELLDFLAPVLAEYTSSVTTGPPAWASTRADACEICERDWIPLSYHHLIPRGFRASHGE